MPKNALISVPDELNARYVEASREIERQLGQTPGAEFLMGLALEETDPVDLAESFIRAAIENPRE